VSKIYQRRLIRLQDERETALELVSFVHDNWYTKSFFNEAAFRGRTLAEIARLAESLETTFITALFAAFEGILREHMSQHHSGTLVPESAGAAFLIDQAAVAQPVRISVSLGNQVHRVRQYRNSLMHPAGRDAAEVSFTEALAHLSRYVGWLPNPYE